MWNDQRGTFGAFEAIPPHQPKVARQAPRADKGIAEPEAPTSSSRSAAIPPSPTAIDRRSHQRVAIDVTGRFMTATREEHPCRVIDMSPGGVALTSSEPPPVGGRIIAYLDHLGRVEGTVARRVQGGFAMTIKATPRRRDKLAAKLTYLANRSALSLPEDRRHERIALTRTRTELTLVNGTVLPIDLIDASVSGSAVGTEDRPEVGTPVFVGAVRGRIVRHLESGLAIEFAQVQDAELLEDALIDGRPG